MYFSGKDIYHFETNLEKMKIDKTRRFIAVVCKIFADNDFEAFFVCTLHTKEEVKLAETLPGCDYEVIDPKKFLSKKKLLILKMPDNEEESINILSKVNKFIMDINAVEYPFIVFGKNGFNEFRDMVATTSRLLVAPTIVSFLGDNSLSKFTSKYSEEILAILTVFDNYLALLMKKDCPDLLMKQLKKKFRY